jgi:hypothetical protein
VDQVQHVGHRLHQPQQVLQSASACICNKKKVKKHCHYRCQMIEFSAKELTQTQPSFLGRKKLSFLPNSGRKEVAKSF